MALPSVTFGRSYTIDLLPGNKRDKKKTVRLRTPDHLPMNHSTTQAQHQAMQQRQRRLATSNDVRKACLDSGNLRQYSRRRFEFAIQNASKDRSLDLPRPYTSPYVSNTNHNNEWTGPTVHGSLLYNRIPLMLNSIRVRPQSESVKYSHSSRTYPDIERTLRKSNCEFTVRNTPVSRGHSLTSCSRGMTSRCSSLDFMLVPLTDQLDVREFWVEDSDDDDGCATTNTWLPVPPRPQVLLDVSGTPVRDRYHNDTMSDSSSETRPISTRPTQNIFSTEIPGATPTRPRPPYSLASNEGRNRLIVTRPGRPSSGSKTGSDQSMSGSVSSMGSTRSERPKCWVDDVTISSEVSEANEENVETPPENDTKQKPGNIPADRGKQKSKPETKQVRLEDMVAADDPVVADDNLQQEVEEEEVDGESEADLSSIPQYVFPQFLCPSSERKSRQAAIKLWLARTSFTCADRNVPLL